MKALLHLMLYLCIVYPYRLSAQEDLHRPGLETERVSSAMRLARTDPQKAIPLLLEELRSDPPNGYAMVLLSGLIVQSTTEPVLLTSLIQLCYQAQELIPEEDHKWRNYLYHYLGSALGRIGQAKSAIQAYTQALTYAPRDVASLFNRAILYAHENQYQSALADLNLANDIEPGREHVLNQIATVLTLDGQLQQAMDTLMRVLKAYPASSRAYTQRGQIHLLRGQYPQAADDLIKAIEIDNPREAFDLFRDLAIIHYPALKPRLMAKLAQGQDPYKWYYHIGVAAESARAYRSAIEAFLKADECAPEPHGLLMNRISSCYLDLGDLSQSLNYIAQAVARTPDRADYRTTYGSLLFQAQRWSEALAQCDTLIVEMADTEDPEIYLLRAKVLRALNRPRDAIRDLSRAIRGDSLMEAFLLRAELYATLGDSIAMRRDYETVARHDLIPRRGGMAHLAFCALGMQTEAIEYIQTLLTDAPESLSVLLSAGRMYAMLNQPEEAIKYLRRAASLSRAAVCTWDTDWALEPIRQHPDYIALRQSVSKP